MHIKPSAKHRSLESLRRSASTSRVLNLASVAERHGALPEYKAQPMFHTPRLNRSIILKHTLRPAERHELATNRPAATKIIIPFAQQDLRLGGASVFIEQETSERALRETLGTLDPTTEFAEDLAILRLLAGLPSLDPFLLRERLAAAGRNVARCYFDLSEADAAHMKSYVAGEIGRLVTLAFAKNKNAGELCSKMAEKLLRDDTASALEPLRETLRLSAEEYQEGVFAWRGFLYYKWNLSSIAPKLRPVVQEILTTGIHRPTSDERGYIDLMRRRIAEGVSHYALQTRTALSEYDSAYDRLVEQGDGAGFRAFLLNAPRTFVMVGDLLGVLSHIVSFWRYRFPERVQRLLAADEAMELFASFESSLSAAPQPKDQTVAV